MTALASVALDIEQVNGVFSTKMSTDIPLKPTIYIAKNKAELIQGIGSKYCPIPCNLLLKKILCQEGQYLVIGLPCHIQGVRKASIKNKRLHDRVSLYFGLACNHSPTFYATKYLLIKLGISENMIEQISYRGNGYPGGMTIQLKDGTKKFVPLSHKDYWGFVFNRVFLVLCLYCV